jgi:hypothetical protein
MLRVMSFVNGHIIAEGSNRHEQVLDGCFLINNTYVQAQSAFDLFGKDNYPVLIHATTSPWLWISVRSPTPIFLHSMVRQLQGITLPTASTTALPMVSVIITSCQQVMLPMDLGLVSIADSMPSIEQIAQTHHQWKAVLPAKQMRVAIKK